jgi:hypothetical protein
MFMKSPAIQYTDEQARLMVEEFIAEYGQGAPKGKAPATTNGHKVAEPAAVTELPKAE